MSQKRKAPRLRSFSQLHNNAINNPKREKRNGGLDYDTIDAIRLTGVAALPHFFEMAG